MFDKDEIKQGYKDLCEMLQNFINEGGLVPYDKAIKNVKDMSTEEICVFVYHLGNMNGKLESRQNLFSFLDTVMSGEALCDCGEDDEDDD